MQTVNKTVVTKKFRASTIITHCPSSNLASIPSRPKVRLGSAGGYEASYLLISYYTSPLPESATTAGISDLRETTQRKGNSLRFEMPSE